MLRLGSLALLGGLLVVAGGSAYAAEPKAAVFTATLTATLTKEWSYVGAADQGNCVQTTRGTGRWRASFTTRRPVRIRAVAAGGGKVRFLGVLESLRGTAIRSASTTTTDGGEPPCERSTRSVRCADQRRSFKNASSVVRNPQKRVAQLGALRGVPGAQSFPSNCTNEPEDIRRIRTDLPLATSPFDRADVFDRAVRRFYLIGDTEQVTTLEGELEGRVTERVRWRLTFTRVSR